MIPQEVIDRILDLDLVTLLSAEGLELKKKGADYWACCPFHGEKTPSFKVSLSRNSYYCFGCQRHGTAISYVMESKGFTFLEAVEYLADRNGIVYEKRQLTPEEREMQFRHEEILRYNRTAQKFFTSQITVPAAAEYIKGRGWLDPDKDAEGNRRVTTVEKFSMGYAPKGNKLSDYLRANGCPDTKIMLAAGLLRRNDDTGDIYETFRNRIIFPIFNESGNIIGFTGRDITGEAGAKYLNTPETELFKKGRILFGWCQARRKVSTLETVIVCEGNPDVIRLHQIGQDYAVAPMGTALTDDQIAILKRKAKKVILIGDVDKAGIAAVEKHGKALLYAGIKDVRVMTLPGDEDDKDNGGVKMDPDEYFKRHKSRAEFDNLLTTATEDYIKWTAARQLAAAKSENERAEVIQSIAALVAQVDEEVGDIYIDNFRKIYKNGSAWTKAINAARAEKDRRISREDGAQEMLQEYGFYEKKKCYFGPGQNGTDRRWSNFVMVPILHIRDEKNARRIFELENSKGMKAVVKFNQSELVSFTDFKTRTETAGNFVWEATANELTILKKFLYDGTPSADEIRQLGWQKKWGFYAWGNGGFDEFNNFIKVDEFGIITIGNRKYYLPGFSKDTQDNVTGYQQQRRFVYAETSNVTLRQFCDQMCKVFGDNAKVGIAFLMATMFRDIVVSVTTSFPILNLFGPKGTGKSELGHALMSLFVSNSAPPNINNTTKAALAEAVAEVSNAPVHLDEYKNNLDLEKREFLKGLWDGAGRSRMNMDDKKSRETTAVDSGVIMSGQEMPTADIALFNRLIFLQFSKAEFSDSEKEEFDRLQLMTKRGLTHLAKMILSLRSHVMTTFRQYWDDALSDLNERVKSHGIEDRTLRNWAIALSAFKCLEHKLDTPFNYDNMLDICAGGCINQNEKTKQNNELSGFWETMEILASERKIQPRVNYTVTTFSKPFKINESGTLYEPRPGGNYLVVNFKTVSGLYAKECRDSDRKKIPVETLKYYLEHSKEFCGTKHAVKFLVPDNINGYINGQDPKRLTTSAMVFDYDELVKNYDISLQVDSDIQRAELDDSSVEAYEIMPEIFEIEK